MIGMAAMTIASTALTAYGQYRQGQAAEQQAEAQAELAEYNAKIAQQEAKAIEQRTIVESRRQAEASARRMGSLHARLAISGVAMSGSPLLIMAEQEEEDVFENQMIGYRGLAGMQEKETEATLLKHQAGIYRTQGKNAMMAAKINAGATLLSGFGSAMGGMGGKGGTGAQGGSSWGAQHPGVSQTSGGPAQTYRSG
jgi:transcriptional regulator of aromatic amino acid metabolism